jgi:hypothetical protein
MSQTPTLPCFSDVSLPIFLSVDGSGFLPFCLKTTTVRLYWHLARSLRTLPW